MKRDRRSDRRKHSRKQQKTFPQKKFEKFRKRPAVPVTGGTVAEGIFIGHPRGFGFVEIEGEEEDIYIPEEDTGTAMHQDRVQVVIRDKHSQGKRREGVITQIFERGM